MDTTAVFIAAQTRSSHARSALPGAPVLEIPAASRRPARARTASASLLMRMAVKLDPRFTASTPQM
jgi:hypothetical protein